MNLPLLCAWDGEVFTPIGRSKKEADASFVVGLRYVLSHVEERSAKSHAHYFAALTEVWRNLPEEQADRFNSVEALRKYALIKTGFADRRDVVCSNNSEAVRLAALVKILDQYSLTAASERSVSIWTAQSQSRAAMGKDEFQRSKESVLEFAALLIGVKPEELKRETGRAA